MQSLRFSQNFSKVLQHQKLGAGLIDSLTTLASKAILVRRDLAISSLASQVPVDILTLTGIFNVLHLPRRL